MRFSIRDLLLVTVIVALAAGWWVDHRRQAAIVAEERAFRSRLIEVPKPYGFGVKSYKRLWAEPYPMGDY